MRSKIKKIVPDWVLALLRRLRFAFIRGLFLIFHLLPINPNLIVVCNVWGFGDNAKYVAKELIRRNKKGTLSCKIVFITNHWEREDESPNIIFYKTNSIKAIHALATARVWVDNNRKEPYIIKRKGQYYIQTWHGGIALKKIEKDYDKLPPSYIKNAKRDSHMTDLYISNSEFCTNMYRNSFWYQGKIAEWGSPRNDILLHCSEERKRAIRKKIGLTEERLVIYAPTYREGLDASIYQLDYDRIITALEERFHETFAMAIRLHPLVAAESEKLKIKEHIHDVSSYGDLYELMAVSDVIITDYSNIMFEFSLCKKPVFLYAKDMEEYQRERGFYFDYKTLPFRRSASQNDLIEHIKDFKQEAYEDRITSFFKRFQLYETGDASSRVGEHIEEILKNKI